MACDDRQISQAQREAGYNQQRTGVVQALRPFSGAPTLENLLDYLNRELVPAVRATRNAANDIYLQVADNAPSANPLAYYFSTDVAASDPTTGRIKLNASPQDTATIIRVSESNARLQSVIPWLDVMSGGATTPLGTVTLVDAVNPGRFLRFDLNTMTDQGTYWDLGVTFIEGSHDDPFVQDEGVVLGFISGVSAAGSTVPVGSLSPIARDTFVGNITTATAAPVPVPLADVDSASIIYDATSHTFQRAALTGAISSTQNSNATLFAGIRSNGVLNPAARGFINVVSTTSIIGDAGDDAVGNEIEFNFQRAALVGAIVAAQNSNATTFGGILDNGAAENNRTNLNFLSSSDVTLTVTDDAANDELEITATLAAGTTQNEGTGGGVTLNAGTKVLAITSNITITGFARSGGNVDGDRFWVRCNDGIECTLQHATGTAANQMSLPYAEDLIVPGRGMMEFRYETTWRAISTGNKGRLLRVTAYTSTSSSTGTHTFLSDCRRYVVHIVSPQGGGGGANSAAAQVAVGGEGGHGFELLLECDDVPASVSYTTGDAGAGGTTAGGDGDPATNAEWDGLTIAGGDGGCGSAHATLGSGSGTAFGITAGGKGGQTITGSLPSGATVVMAKVGQPGLPGVRMSGSAGWGGGYDTDGATVVQGGGGMSRNNTDELGRAGGIGRITVWEYT